MNTTMDNTMKWKIINSHFHEDPHSLVRHHLESFNDFYNHDIFKIFKENNPVRLSSKYDESIEDYREQCLLYFGGKDGSKIYYGKPVIYDDTNAHYMFPNEARMRNMTYGMTVHYDIEVEIIRILEPGQEPTLIGLETVNDLVEPDYTEEREEYLRKKAMGKLKSDQAKKQTDEEKKKTLEPNSDSSSDDDETKSGGAPVKPRQKKPELPMKLTAAIAAKIREENEKSMQSQNKQVYSFTLDKIYLGKFPIMMHSEFCVLHGLSREVRFSMGECRNDLGGYFIIDGKEKTVVPQEKFADNMLYIRKYAKEDVDDDDSDELAKLDYLYSAEIRSVSENVSKPVRTFSIRMVAPDSTYANKNLVVNIPNVRKPIPLFIVFRALGIISDKDIITTCLLDMEKYESMVDLFIPSVHDAGGILTQQTALMYIATFTKINTVTYVMEVLADYFLPHIGETNYLKKAYFLGYMVFRLLSVHNGMEPPTDRDNFKYKRIELVGSLMNELFREYYTMYQKSIHLDFEKILFKNKPIYESNLAALIRDNHRTVLKERIVDDGFRKAFKGNWGATAHTKRIGVVQDMNRLSFNSALSHLRKTNLPMDAGVKLVGPRVLHSSQWGFIDPIDTPDGGNIGLHKHLAMMTYVSRNMSREPIIHWLIEKASMKMVEDCDPSYLSSLTKVIVNGLWAGALTDPVETIKKIRLFKRNALLPLFLSASFDIQKNTIFIYSDGGRLCRPIFYRDDSWDKLMMSYEHKEVAELIKTGEFTWSSLVSGFNPKKADAKYRITGTQIYELPELLDGIDNETNPKKIERCLTKKAIIDYIDPSESEDAFIAFNTEEADLKKHTHVEIHESLLLGMMCNQIIFPENNPPTRNSFSCGQSKQAVSMYHTNHQVRMDKTAVILNSGQIPLVKSRYMEHINHEENPYGENAIVAIMCYTGYNVEDAVLMNEGSLKRGLFRTTYYTTYESHEETSENAHVVVDKRFTNIERTENVVGLKPGCDYSKLDAHGLVREGVEVNDKMVLIGLTTNSVENKAVRRDESKMPKKGQLGIVDKTYMTEGEEGERIAKVRVREERIPNLGDKMASRSGQKGTVGMIIPECDMPFTREGLRPDIIINPHAIPSRMTIGQLVECIMGKVSVEIGGFSDCTAFNNQGSKIGLYGELLTKAGFHSSGNEVLYNGMTGDQIETEIFVGPTYYMRLKHMVKDKINYRAQGPRTALTRQPVSGRANDGGLRIGEMERDVVISHGANEFLRESMMDRGDKYRMAVCNKTGMIAIYNPDQNIFMSPMADGPLKYTDALDGKSMRIETVSRFGRDFSVVAIPYSLKLLIQELQTMNLQMRIITEDNINQMENMAFSRNIGKLMQSDGIVDPMKVVQNTREQMTKTVGAPAEPVSEPTNYERDPLAVFDNISPLDNSSPEFVPGSSDSLPYAPGSSPFDATKKYYNSESEELMQNNQVSPQFAPESPPFAPGSSDSPPFAPGSSDSLPFAPDSPALMSGGNVDQDFAIGEIVYMRGGKDTNVPHKIIKNGDKFLTVESLMPFANDPIQVVYKNEVCRQSDIPDVHAYEQAAMFNQPRIQNYEQPGLAMPAQSGITFAPNIKIVNGNDNSTDNTPSTTTIPAENAMFNKPIIQVGGSDKPEVAKADSVETPAVSSGGEPPPGFFNSVKDFVIKKLG
jgi:DNA-directed RNA polymerase II subunit RPB2